MGMPRVALAVMVALGVGACGGTRERAVISSSAATTTTAEMPTTTAEATTTPPSTTVPVLGSSSTTLRRQAAPVTTSLRSTTTRPLATTTSAGPPQCSSAQLTVDVTTDKVTYRPGELVRTLATLRNRSGAPCRYDGFSGSSRFSGPAGQPVGSAGMLIGEGGPGFGGPTTFAPGETMTQNPTYDQKICVNGAECAQAPPGTYAVTVDWTFSGSPIVGSKTFVLIAA